MFILSVILLPRVVFVYVISQVCNVSCHLKVSMVMWQTQRGFPSNVSLRGDKSINGIYQLKMKAYMVSKDWWMCNHVMHIWHLRISEICKHVTHETILNLYLNVYKYKDRTPWIVIGELQTFQHTCAYNKSIKSILLQSLLVVLCCPTHSWKTHQLLHVWGYILMSLRFICWIFCFTFNLCGYLVYVD